MSAQPNRNERQQLTPDQRDEKQKQLHEFLYKHRDIVDRAINDQFRGFLTAEFLIESALVTAQNAKDAEFYRCSPLSILYGLTLAGRTGLRIGAPYNESYLIVRWNASIRCEWAYWDPSYRGLMKLARRTGTVATIQADVVRQNDQFEFERTLQGATLRHCPVLHDRGPLVRAYAIATFLNGAQPICTVLDGEDIARHRKASKGSDSDYSPWKQHPGPMWAKSAIRDLCKWLELSDEIAVAIDAANNADGEIIDRAVNALVPGQQVALPESSAEPIDMTGGRQPVTVGRERGKVDVTVKPAAEPNRGHGNEGFGPAAPRSPKPAAPRQTAPPVEQPRKPEPGSIVSKQGLVQIRQATAAWNRDQQDRFLSEFGIDALEQLQASVFREALAWIEAENGGGGGESIDGPPSVARDFTDEQIAALDATAQQNGLDEGWVRSTLPAWLGLGSKPITAAPIGLFGRASQLVLIAAMCRKTNSDLTVALDFFRVASIAELTDQQIDGVLSNLKTKYLKQASPFEGQ